MTSTLLNLSGKIDHLTISVLRRVQQVARIERIPFFIVGATARDILLEAAHEIAHKRATIDIDLAVFLQDWDQFDRIKNALIENAEFEPAREIHRLIFQGRLPVDIVPYGSIAGSNKQIKWPPDQSIRMSVVGFEECYQNSIPIQLADSPELVARVVSLAGLAILKLISWDDSTERRRKDASDLCCIIQNYLDAGNLERLFVDAPDIVETDDYEHEHASARLLGRDMANIAYRETKAALTKILEEESIRASGHRIAMDALQNDGLNALTYERMVAYFDLLLKGLTEENSP